MGLKKQCSKSILLFCVTTILLLKGAWGILTTVSDVLDPLTGKPIGSRVLAAGVDCSVVVEITVDEIQAAYAAGTLTAVQLTECYLQRIRDYSDPSTWKPSFSKYAVNAFISITPTVLMDAAAKDKQRAAMCGSKVSCLGKLYGIPVALKDNIGVEGMPTTAGSYALLNCTHEEATLTKLLRSKGVILIGKANLSQWAFWRSSHGISGWSSVGGQTYDPYVRYLRSNITVDDPYSFIKSVFPNGTTFTNVNDPSIVSGSSGGSAVAVTMNLATLAVGSDTGGSVVDPSSAASIVGIRPTAGLISRYGIVPLSHSSDTAGPMGRTVTDVAYLLDALYSVDPADEDTVEQYGHTPPGGSYTQYLKKDGLKGMTVAASALFSPDRFPGYLSDAKISKDYLALLDQLRAAGATVDYYQLPPPHNDSQYPLPNQQASTIGVFAGDFKYDIAQYLAGCTWKNGTTPLKTLTDLRYFNIRHADLEFQGGQCCRDQPAFADYYQDLFDYSDEFHGFYYDLNYLRQKLEVGNAATALFKFFGGDNQYRRTYDVFIHFGENHFDIARARMCTIALPWSTNLEGAPQGLWASGLPWTEGKLIQFGYGFEQTIMKGKRLLPTFCDSYTCFAK